jgi:hypothetical protein
MTTLFDLDHLIEIFTNIKKNKLGKQEGYVPFEEYENRRMQMLPSDIRREDVPL